MSKRRALLTGITGQDGSYLAEFLLSKGYEVHGLKRRTSLFNTQRVEHLYALSERDKADFYLHHGDMTDTSSLLHVIGKVQPHECYNLAAQSHVAVSFEEPEYTANSDAIGALRILEVIRMMKESGHDIRYYQASTSEMFGNSVDALQTENSPLVPRSPYGAAKVYAHSICAIYREAYGLFACNGILFNHESPRRGETFVSRKITRGLAQVKLGMIERLALGNLNALRDWGHARDYVEAQWLMLQQSEPEDFVIATGEQRSVRDFVEAVASRLDMNIEWSGEGLQEVGVDRNTDRVVVEVDNRYMRPTEVDELCGDASKARRQLGWRPKTSFDDLVDEMVAYDLEQMKQKAESDSA